MSDTLQSKNKMLKTNSNSSPCLNNNNGDEWFVDCPPTKIDDSIMAKFDEIVPEFHSTKSNDSNSPEDRMLQFLCFVGRLKTLPRRGWIVKDRNISNPEPIAGHMYRMAIMSMLFEDDEDDSSQLSTHIVNGNNTASAHAKPEENVNGQTSMKKKPDIVKMMQLSLVHDMAECIVGDITPFDKIEVDKKHQYEMDAIKCLVDLLPTKSRDRLLSLYMEYEGHLSAESLLVKEMDRFDLALQAYQYERQEFFNRNRTIQFDKFFTVAFENIRHPLLCKMIDRLMKEREKWWQQQIRLNPQILEQLKTNGYQKDHDE